MTAPTDDTAPRDDHEFAAWVADRAGARLLEVRATSGLEGRELKNAGDAVFGALSEWRYARGTLAPENVELLRAFGARFWVVHVDELAPHLRANVPEAFGPVRKIATLDEGRTVVYEDPEPKARRE